MKNFTDIEELKNVPKKEIEKVLKFSINHISTIEHHQGRAMGALLVMSIENGFNELTSNISKQVRKLMFSNEIPDLTEYDSVLEYLNLKRESLLPNIGAFLKVLDEIESCFYKLYGKNANGKEISGFPVPSKTPLKSYALGYMDYMSSYYESVSYDRGIEANTRRTNEIIKPMFS